MLYSEKINNELEESQNQSYWTKINTQTKLKLDDVVRCWEIIGGKKTNNLESLLSGKPEYL